MASSQFEGDANSDGAIVVNIEPTQPIIVEKLTPARRLAKSRAKVLGNITPAYGPVLEG